MSKGCLLRLTFIEPDLLKGRVTLLLSILVFQAKFDTGAGETSWLSIRVRSPGPGAAIMTADSSRPSSLSLLGLV